MLKPLKTLLLVPTFYLTIKDKEILMNKLLLLSLLFSISTYAAEKLTTDSFPEMQKKIEKLGKKYGVKNVLVAFDIDNTLMALPQNFGSDQWFNWQSENCIGKKKAPDFCATTSFGELLDLQGKIFAVSNMVPTHDKTVDVVKDLQKKGYKVILLTSRGKEFRNATYRALKMNNMWFTKSAIGPKGGYPSHYKPYDLKNLKGSGITKEESIVAKLKKPRSVSYQDGVFMGAGQHKGIMLKSLLHKTKSKFKAIVFADDHEKHTKRMHQIFGKKKGIELVTYRYSKIDPMVKNFNEKQSAKNKAINHYKEFQAALNNIFK